jgi:hypothetical protein
MFAARTRILAASLAPAILLIMGGCVFPGTAVVSTELPAPLQAIVSDPAAFSTDPNHPLTAVTPGTLVDDLAGLTGCWGYCSDGEMSEQGVSPWAFYEAYQFDAETGLANRWVLSPRWLLIPALMVVDEGTFDVVDTGRIEITLERYTLTPGGLGFGRQFTELPTEIAVVEKLVTLSGDELLLASPDYVDEESGVPLGRVFVRFDCPD